MLRCARGTYQDLAGQSSCKTCPAGYYCNEVQIHPIICPAGSFCPAGAAVPVKCPRGTYGGSLGLTASSQCKACNAGAYCTQTGLTSPDGLCDPGYYCIAGAITPNPTDGTTGNVCQVGGFCEYGSKRVVTCPPGTYNPSTAAKT